MYIYTNNLTAHAHVLLTDSMGMGMGEGDIVSTYSVTMVVAGVAEQHVLHVPVLILGSGHNVISSFPIQPPGFYTDLAVHGPQSRCHGDNIWVICLSCGRRYAISYQILWLDKWDSDSMGSGALLENI